MRTKLSLFCDKVVEAGWLAAVVVVPLFFNIHSNRVFEPDKLSLLRSIALVMAGSWLVRTVEDWRVRRAGGPAAGSAGDPTPGERRPWYKTPLVLPTLVLVVVYLVSTALSIAPAVSLLGSYQRLQGTYTTLSYIVVFALMLQGLRSSRQLNRLITTVVVVSVPIALYGLVQHFGLDPLPWGGDVTTRVASNMGNAIFVAAYMLMVVPLTLSRLVETWKETVGGGDSSGAPGSGTSALRNREVLLGGLAFLVLVVALLAGMLWPAEDGGHRIRWVALLVGVALQVPIYLLSPADQRPRVLAIALPLTFAFLVAFSWILELFFPPAVPNYFWLGLLASLIFVLAMVAFANYLGKPVARLLLLAAYLIILIAQLLCIFYTQSRGPLLGLLAGVFFYLAILGLVKRRVWVPWVMSVLAIGALLFLVMFNTVDSPLIERLRETPYVGRLGKVMQTESGSGKVRILIWEGAIDLISPHTPLVRPGEDGGPDSLNAIRPVLGYGPESMYVAYNRFYPPELAHFEKRNASPDRSHNETLDALVTTGWIGLAAYLLLFGSVFYYGLKWLGLIRERWQRWTFAGLLLGGSIALTAGLWAWRGPAYLGVGIPIGAILGLAVYVLISLVLATFRPQQWGFTDRPYQIWVLALLAAIVAHFVEIQFGIAIAATRTYFWAFSAALVVVGSRLAQQPEQAEPEPGRTAIEPGVETAESAARRRRRRGASAPVPDPSVAARQDWVGYVIVLSVLAILVLGTMLFDWITPQAEDAGVLSILWRSLTRKGGESSPVMLVLFLVTWSMLGLVGLSDLATRGESGKRDVREWLKAAGIFVGVSFAGALSFALIHAVNLKPATISRDVISSPVVNTITVYYLFLLAVIVGLAAVLTFLFQRQAAVATTIPWRRSGDVADVGVVAAVVVLPALVLLLILVSNVSIVRADIWYKQGLSSEKLGQWDAAVRFYDQAARLAPDEDFYFLFLGRALMERGRSSEPEEQDLWMQASEQALLRARQIAPYNTDHSRNLSKLYLSWGMLSQGDQRTELLKQSLAMSADALALSPNTVDVLNERAQVYASMGDVSQALDMYQQSLALDDQYAQTYLSLGALYASQQEWDQAIAAYQKAQQLKPKSGDVYADLGYVYSRAGDRDAALDAYLKAVELRPRNYLDWQNLAVLYYQSGQDEDAIRAANMALELAPDSEKSALESFIAQVRQSGSTSLSPEDAQKVEELHAQGRTEIQAEDWTAAEATYRAIVDLDVTDAVAHSALAYLYAKLGRLDEAITENLAVLDLLPNDYSSHKNLAILYRQAGDITKAIAAATQALALAPEEDRQALQDYLDQLNALGGSPGATAQSGPRAGDLAPEERNNMYSAPPPMTIDPAKSYEATIVTEKGNIVLELYASQAPNTVNNFVFLARQGYYDNTTFHRVIAGFMAQAGDPTGTGSGGPGYRFADEFSSALRHDGPGVLSMANAGANTNGSQFFITYEATPWLDDHHTVFGRVIEGMDVLEALTPRDPQKNPDFVGDRILTIVIQEQ